jgi:PAS domain S-box-containing protein
MQRAVSNARNGIIITDCSQPDHPIIYANAAFFLLTGYSSQEVVGRNCRFLQGPDTDSTTRARLRAAVDAGESIRVEIKNYRKDGSAFWNDLLLSPLFDEGGRLTHFVGNQLDITRRKALEAELTEERAALAQRVDERTRLLNDSRDYLASIVETVRTPLVILDHELIVLSANEMFYATFAITPGETEGVSLFELGNNQWDIPALRKLLHNILPAQSTFDGVEVEHTFPQIGRRTMLLNARQIELNGSKQQRILLGIEDISERVRAEASSLRDGALTQAILSSIGAHIAVIDQEGLIIAVNEAWRRFAVLEDGSLDSNAFLSSNYLEVLRHAPADDGGEAPLALAGIEAVLAGQLPSFSLEYPCDTPTQQLWFLLQVTPLAYESGGAVVAHIDITEQKRLEQRKDDFIGMASHELRTPLTSLRMYTQLLERQLTREEAHGPLKQLGKMHAQLNRLTRLVQELLDVSRIYAGKLELRRAPFQLETLAADVVDMVQATSAELVITIEGATTNPVVGDSERIEQVLINLLTNATKYSPPGAPITVTLAESASHATVWVRDCGIGIAPTHHERVFERFYQVDDTAAKTYPGLGMGLYIARQIVEAHQGSIWVESTPGAGATFAFSLPLQQREPAAPPSPEAAKQS